MRIEELSIGENPPEDVNVIIEVPVGGQPIKYELDKKSCPSPLKLGHYF